MRVPGKPLWRSAQDSTALRGCGNHSIHACGHYVLGLEQPFFALAQRNCCGVSMTSHGTPSLLEFVA